MFLLERFSHFSFDASSFQRYMFSHQANLTSSNLLPLSLMISSLDLAPLPLSDLFALPPRPSPKPIGADPGHKA